MRHFHISTNLTRNFNRLITTTSNNTMSSTTSLLNFHPINSRFLPHNQLRFSHIRSSIKAIRTHTRHSKVIRIRNINSFQRLPTNHNHNRHNRCQTHKRSNSRFTSLRMIQTRIITPLRCTINLIRNSRISTYKLTRRRRVIYRRTFKYSMRSTRSSAINRNMSTLTLLQNRSTISRNHNRSPNLRHLRLISRRNTR